MRTWLLHPIIFYPLVAFFAALVIAVSAKPQWWPRPAAAAFAQRAGAALVLSQASFDAPASDPEQNVYVTRNVFGQAQSLRIAVLPNQGAPDANDRGVRILLAPDAAAQLSGRQATIIVSYNPLAVNAATALAVSIQGAGPTQWVTQAAPPQHAALRFEVPAESSVTAVGLRTLNGNASQSEAFGLEITRISITPHT